MGTQLTLVFHIQEADSGFTATFDSPDQGALGIPFTSVEFNDDTLLLSAANIGAFYEGVPAADSIAGIWSQGGQSLELNLFREEVGKVQEYVPRSPNGPILTMERTGQLRIKRIR